MNAKIKNISHYEWMLRLRYALVAAGVVKHSNYVVLQMKIDEKSWEHFWEEGYTPVEAVLEDLKNA